MKCRNAWKKSMQKKTQKQPNKPPFVIGVTGSIGMGKTTVSDMFQDLGIPVNNADKDVHKSMGPNGAAVAAIAAFLPEALRHDEENNPYIDRATLSKHAANDPSVFKKLEDILHPIVGQLRDDFIDDMTAAGHDIILCDIPLLFETNLDKDMDLTICVSAPEKVQKKRVLARPGMTEEKLEAFLKRQLPDKDKRQKSDKVLDTLRIAGRHP